MNVDFLCLDFFVYIFFKNVVGYDRKDDQKMRRKYLGIFEILFEID